MQQRVSTGHTDPIDRGIKINAWKREDGVETGGVQGSWPGKNVASATRLLPRPGEENGRGGGI